LSNAIRFSPRGGAIRFMIESSRNQVRIDCIDEGPGVAPQDAQRIFEPFQQGERQPQEARHGSGIGLAIVREFISAHGGTVRLLASARGAHFRVELPREAIPAAHAAGPLAAADVHRQAPLPEPPRGTAASAQVQGALAATTAVSAFPHSVSPIQPT
jgi:signal transduction histidine kinase